MTLLLGRLWYVVLLLLFIRENQYSMSSQLDGHDITELNVQEFRKHMALVSQEPTLYSGSIRFNILLGATKPQEEVTQEELEQACRDANILEFIQSLPEYVLISPSFNYID